MLPTSCKYPTTIVFLDDDESFLNGITLNWENKKERVKTFTNPSKCLGFLENAWTGHSYGVENGWNELDENKSIKFNIGELLKFLNNPRKGEEVSVVIVDYRMPEIDGLSFLGQIKDKKTKRVLLTGVADENLAINALNNNLIDFFIKKDVVVSPEAIESAILGLEAEFFCEREQKTIGFVLEEMEAHKSSNFQDMLAELVRKFDISEYCIINTKGCYLLKNNSGELKNCYISPADDYNLFIEHEVLPELDQKIAQRLMGKKEMFCFSDKYGPSLEEAIKSIEKYIFPAFFSRNEKYIYAVSPNLLTLSV